MAYLRLLLLFSISSFLFVGCGGKSVQVRSDEHNVISFELPDGWVAVPGSNETRFYRADSKVSQIQVTTILTSEPRDLAGERDQWLKFKKKSGLAILHSKPFTQNGFEGVDYAHEEKTSRGDAVMHQIHFQRSGFIVLTHLNATKDQYEEYLPVYTELVRSIRAEE